MNRKGSIVVAIAIVVVIALAVIAGIWYYEEVHQTSTAIQSDSAFFDKSWIGDYTFSEYAPPNETWVYDLTVLNSSSGPSAALDINGFQTEISLMASVQESTSGTLSIFFQKDNGSGPPLTYSAGDPLFSIMKTNKGDTIMWEKMQPMLAHDLNGAIFIPSAAK